MAARVSQPELAAPPLAARPRMARGEEERVARATRDRGEANAGHRHKRWRDVQGVHAHWDGAGGRVLAWRRATAGETPL